MIKRLIYTSELVEGITEQDLKDILEKSRKNNALGQLTGFLARSGNHVFQVLEGEECSLKNRLDVITRDNRHHEMTIIEERDTQTRLFGSWSMSFRELDKVAFEETKKTFIEASGLNIGKKQREEFDFLVNHNTHLQHGRIYKGDSKELLNNCNVLLYSQDKNLEAKLSQIFGKNKVKRLDSHVELIANKYLDDDVDFLVLDNTINTKHIFDMCHQIKQNYNYENIRVIVFSELMLSLSEEYAFELGADDFINKSSGINAIAARFLSHARARKNKKDLDEKNTILEGEREEILQTLNHMREQYSPKESSNFKYYLSPLNRASGDIVLSRVNTTSSWYLIGDFTGHGIVASIASPIVANIFTKESIREPHQLLKELNIALKAQIPLGRFMAACLVELDEFNKMLNIWNVGMPAQLAFCEDDVSDIDSTFIPLGIDVTQDFSIPSKKLGIKYVDSLFCYTDGLSDSLHNHLGDSVDLKDLLAPWLAQPKSKRPSFKALMDFILGMIGESIKDDVTIMSLVVDN